MSEKQIFIDIHCHPSMKPFYSSINHSDKKNIWEFIPENTICENICKNKKKNERKKKSLGEMIRYSQMNLDSCYKGDVRVLFISLYPIERGWFNERKLADLFTKDKVIARMASCSSGIDINIVNEIRNAIDGNNISINYFDDLVREYHYLNSDQAKSKDINKQFVIVNSFDEVNDILSNPDDKRIILILSIEGGHSLCKFESFHDLKNTPYKKVNSAIYEEFDKYRKIYFDHIDVIKGRKNYSIKLDGKQHSVKFVHTPFYITFAHHFWNLLCGHTDSFGFKTDLVLNQSLGKGKGFTKLGIDVLHKLLQKSKTERRILIDIKHFSVKSRMEFYSIWEKEFYSKGDGFPIISSHTAVNGRDDYFAMIHNDDGNETAYYNSFYNTSSINMFDHDIKMIHKSDGLIGLILNETRLPGIESTEVLKYNKKKIKYCDDTVQIEELKSENKQEYLKCITANIFHIVRVINNKSAWSIITIGSDFDGMIDALDSYTRAEDFSDLAKDLADFIDNCTELDEIELNSEMIDYLKFGYTTKEIIKMITCGNALEHLRKYFNDKYLKAGTIQTSSKVIV